jgi:type I restriction enzyme S subunit
MELKAATMAKLFREGLRGEHIPRSDTRFGEVPQEWKIESLNEHAYVQTGIAKGRKLDSSFGIELPYLRVANVQDGYLDLSEIKTIRLREAERERYSLQVNDILLTEGGDFDKLGRGYLWKGQIENCVHQNHIFAVRTNQKTLLPEFFVYLVQSPYGKAYFLSVAHKTTNLACINSHKLKAFPILLPSLSDQREIAAILTGIDRKIDQHTHKLKTFRYLFSSMLHLLMTGQVRVAQGMAAET